MTMSRALWSKKRNWLLYRLSGARAIFDVDVHFLLHTLLDSEDWHLTDDVKIAIEKLIQKINESKYKEN